LCVCEEVPSGFTSPEAEVSRRRGWDRLVGGAVSGVAGAWYSGGGAKALWSLRLDVDDRSVVIALGGRAMTASGTRPTSSS
jgi:hypothetical protein